MSIISILKGVFVFNDLEKQLLKDREDPPLVLKHAVLKDYRVQSKQIQLQTFILPHYKQSKLPKVPLVLFIHGLGGQLNQFEHLIDCFSHFATILAVDLPGHGRSPYYSDWNVYKHEYLIDLLETVITQNDEQNSEVVIIAHSMGSVLAAKLAARLDARCVGMVCICPPAVIDTKLESSKQYLPYIPTFIFNLFRSIDRQGGLHSQSVNRMIGPANNNHNKHDAVKPPQREDNDKEDNDDEDVIRAKQLRWNLQVNSRAWMRTAYNFQPATSQDWSNISCPIYVIGAANDLVTPADENISTILQVLSSGTSNRIESTIVPNAGHAILIQSPKVLCGLISDFILSHVNEKLSLSWQLAFLAQQSDKWSLKNEQKWRSVRGVGDRLTTIQNNPTNNNENETIQLPFRGIKTFRQEDDHHSPENFEVNYPDVTDIIDISRESPPYDRSTFKRIRYHKFPTVSKIPPPDNQVKEFIQLVDECIDRQSNAVIAIHCHYGFNRTGFFICSYLVEKRNLSIKDAVASFAQSRPPGIKHPHFIDELYVRYDLRKKRSS